MATNTEKIVVQIQVKGQKDLDKLGVKTDKATKKVGGLNKGIAKMAAGFFAAATAFRLMNSAITGSIKSFKDFEFQMAKVKAVTGASEKDFKKLTNTAKELGRTTFFTATQVATLQTNYAKLGFSTQEILDAQKATLDLATATDTDLGRAAIVAGAAIRGFGLDASEAGRVVDVMTKAFTSSALDIEKFQTSMTKVAAIAAGANISLEATTAVMGTLTDAGIEASIAGTSLRNIFLKMQDSSSDLSKFLGYTVNSSDDLERALNDLNKAGLSNEQIMSLVDLRQVAAFNTMVGGSERIKELTNDLNNATGAAADLAAIVADTLEGSFKRFTSATEGLSIQLMEDMGGGLKDIVNKLANLVTAFTNNSTVIVKIIRGFATLVKWIGLYTAGSLAAAAATTLFKNAVLLLNGGLKITRAAIAKTGVGVFAVLLGELASRYLLVGDAAETAAKKMQIFNIAKDRQLSREEDLMKLINQQLALTEKQSERNLANIKVQIDARENLKKGLTDEIDAGMLDIKQKKENKKEIKLINSELALLVSNQGLRMINQRKLIDNESQEILQTKSLITLAEEELAILMRMPETTEKEIADKNKLVDTLKLEIDRLKDLGREKDAQVEKNKELIEWNPYQSSLEDLEELKRLDKKNSDDMIASSKKVTDKKVEDGERVLSQAKQTADMLFQIFNQNSANRTKRETKELEEKKDAGLISQEQYEEEVLKIEKAAFEKKKRLDIAQAIINGALAMTTVAGQTGVLSFAFSPFIAAMVAAQIGIISSQKFANGGMIEEFANGGLVQGKSHAQGGEKFAVGGRVVELEGGEAVINKRSTSMFSSQLSAMNAAGGGVKFADGGLLNQPSFSQQQFNALGQNQMMGAMGSSGKVVVVEADITESQNTVSVIQSQATI